MLHVLLTFQANVYSQEHKNTLSILNQYFLKLFKGPTNTEQTQATITPNSQSSGVEQQSESIPGHCPQLGVCLSMVNVQ